MEFIFYNIFHASGDQNNVSEPLSLRSVESCRDTPFYLSPIHTLNAHVTDEVLDEMFVDCAIVRLPIQAVEVPEEVTLLPICSASAKPFELEGDSSTSKCNAAG